MSVRLVCRSVIFMWRADASCMRFQFIFHICALNIPLNISAMTVKVASMTASLVSTNVNLFIGLCLLFLFLSCCVLELLIRFYSIIIGKSIIQITRATQLPVIDLWLALNVHSLYSFNTNESSK